MGVHPSLSADFEMPEMLNPRAVMGRNDPCWCGSDKKWKRCHKDRSEQEPLPIGKLMDQMRRSRGRKYCYHPRADSICGKRAISSHTIQRNGALSEISESGHVLSVRDGAEQIFENEGLIIPRRVGCRSASTFAGFCGNHDSEMFRPIETGERDISLQSVFLLSFRALAFEHFNKVASIAITDVQRACDKGRPFEHQVGIQQMLHLRRVGAERAILELESWKARYDQAFLSQDYSGFFAYACIFSDLLPVACCGAVQPDYSISGELLQLISRGDSDFENVSITLTPINGLSVLTIGWFGDPDGPGQKFAESFCRLEDGLKSNVAALMAFQYSENTFMRPSWWQGLRAADKDSLIRRIMNFNISTGSPWADFAPQLFSSSVMRETAWGWEV